MFDYTLPPVFLWIGIATTWFLANSIVRDRTGYGAPWQPKVFHSILTVLLCLLGGAMILGPIPFIGLLGVAAFGFLRSIFQRVRMGKGVFAAMLAIGIVHVIAIVLAASLSMHIKQTRTLADYVRSWGKYSPGGVTFALSGVEPAKPESLAAWRSIATDGSVYLLDVASKHLGDHGDPGIDIPLLEGAKTRAPDQDTREKIDRAIEKLKNKKR
jgi:hypothetical protein